MNFFKKKINFDKFFVCIGKNFNDGRVNMPFLDDLLIYFVEENKYGSYGVVMEKNLKKIGISVEELYEISKENVKKRIFNIYQEIPLQRNKEDEVLIPYDADIIIQKGMYNFWTSIVLIEDFWNKNSKLCIEKNWDKYYIAMPYRTWLIIGNADNDKSKSEILRLIEDYNKQDKGELIGIGDFEAGNKIISNNIYLMENGKINKI